MKRSQLRNSLLAVSALSVSIAAHLQAATFTSVLTGDWSNPATWGGGFPNTYVGDDAVVTAATIISYDGAIPDIGGNLAVANGHSITINGGTLNQTWVPGGTPPFGTAIAIGLSGSVNGSGTLSINGGGNFDSGTANAVAVGVTSTALGGAVGNGIVNVSAGTFRMGAASSGAGGQGLAIGIDAGAVGVFSLGDGAGAVNTALLDLSTNNSLLTIGGQLATGTGGTGTLTIKSDGRLNQGSASINVGDNGFSTGTLAVDGGTLQGGGGQFRIGTGGGSGTLALSAGLIDRTGNNLVLGNGFGSTGVFTQSGGTLDLHGGHLLVGEGGHGTYNMTAGTVSNVGWFHVGSGGGSVGEMNVNFTNPADVLTGTDLYLGNNSATGTLTVNSGTLRINNFGEVGRGSGTGTLNVTGPTARVIAAAAGGDPFFNVGASNGHGFVNITGGGQLHTTNTWFALGVGDGTTGEATVSGSGSKLTSKGLIVGWNGLTTGTLNISDNAVVDNSARELSVGRDNNNTAGIINIGSGGTLNNSGVDAFIGHNGIGTLNMTGGSFNESNSMFLGAGPGASGTLYLTGPGAVTAANFHVGRSGGVGHVVQSAGSVVSNSWSNIGDDAGPAGSDYRISGGSFTVAGGGMELGRTRGGAMAISGTGTVSIAGELAIVGSHAGGNGALTLAGGGTLNVTTNNGLVLGYDENSNGIFTQTGGTLNMNGHHLQIGGSGGTASGTYNITAGTVNNVGWFHVGSNAGSNGAMNVSLSNPAGVVTGNQLYLGNNNGTGTVTVTSGTLQIDDLAEVGRFGGTGTLAVVGLNSRVVGAASGGDPFFKVGREGGHGIVNITAGGQLHTTNTWFTLGENNGVGEATVSGAGSSLTSRGLIVGWNGSSTGTLTIEQNAVVTNSGREVSVGRDNTSNGTITVKTGGVLDNTAGDYIEVGKDTVGAVPSVGTVNLNGGTIMAGNWIGLGHNGGDGHLNMTAGAITFAREFYLGIDDNGHARTTTGVANITGGSITQTGGGAGFFIGRDGGNGQMTIAGANPVSLVSLNEFNIGKGGVGSGGAQTQGTLNINNASAVVSSANGFYVGRDGGRGTVNQTAGTVSETNEWVTVGATNGSIGTYNISGGILNPNFLEVGADGAGTAMVSGTAQVLATQVTIGTRDTGVGVVTVTGGLFKSNGKIAVGGDQSGGTGTLNANGGVIQAQYLTALEASDAVNSATLSVNGGTLRALGNEADFIRGFSGTGTHSAIDILAGDATIDSGTFNIRITGSSVIANPGDALINGLAGTVLNKEGTGQLTIEGEAGDGFLAVHAKAGILDFESSQTLDALVIDGGATVTLSDLSSPPAPPAPAAAAFDTGIAAASVLGVPEPGAIGLLLVSALGMLGRRRLKK